MLNQCLLNNSILMAKAADEMKVKSPMIPCYASLTHPKYPYPATESLDSRLHHSNHSLDTWSPLKLCSAQLLQLWVVALALLCP